MFVLGFDSPVLYQNKEDNCLKWVYLFLRTNISNPTDPHNNKALLPDSHYANHIPQSPLRTNHSSSTGPAAVSGCHTSPPLSVILAYSRWGPTVHILPLIHDTLWAPGSTYS